MTYRPLDEVRWGIIGCGAVTELKSGPAFNNVANSSLVAVMRRDGDKARDYALRHGVPRWYDDAQALIDDVEVNAIYVATPPSTHMDFALRVIAAGKPVYVEKPLAMTAEEGTRIIEASRAAGVPAFAAYYRRMLPRFDAVRRLLLDQRVIGAPRLVNVVFHTPHDASLYADPENLPWRVEPELAGGGIFVDIGCHTLDILDWLLGPIVSANGVASSQLRAYPAEDTVAMSFAFGSGVLGTGAWNFCSGAPEDRVEIIGEHGRMVFATFGDGSIRVETNSGKVEHHVDNPLHIQQPLIESIVAELRGAAGACPSTVESANRTARVIDQVLQSYRTRLD